MACWTTLRETWSLLLGTIEGTDDDDLLPIDITIDATVDLGPTGDEEDAEIPRFESNPTTAVTVIESSPSRTTLRVPFVTNDGSFETGVAVANMSGGSNAQPGAIMLDLYVGGTKMSYKTSSKFARLRAECQRHAGARQHLVGPAQPGVPWVHRQRLSDHQDGLHGLATPTYSSRISSDFP